MQSLYGEFFLLSLSCLLHVTLSIYFWCFQLPDLPLTSPRLRSFESYARGSAEQL